MWLSGRSVGIDLLTRGFSIPPPRGVSDWDHYGKLVLVRVV
jgi:hypothetical protein